MAEDILKGLFDSRESLMNDLRAHVEDAEKRKEWTAEDASKSEGLNKELDSLDSRIDDITKHEARQKELDEKRAEYEKSARPEEREREDDDEQRLVDWMRSFQNDKEFTPRGIEVKMPGTAYRAALESRTQSKLTAAAGGNVVGTSFRNTLYEHLIDASMFRQLGPTVITTDSGEDMIFPKTTAHGGAALVAEAGTIPASDATFGQVTLGAYKYGKLTQVSNELVTDSPVNLLDYLARDTGAAIGAATGAHYIAGTGSGQPQGIFATGGAATGVTGPTGTATSLGAQGTANQGADALLNLIYSLLPPYRARAKFLMNDASVKIGRVLKDTTGQYIWANSTQAGVPPSLWGYPVFTDPNVPVMAANAKSIAFGDFSAYYIRDVSSLRYERSDDFAFNQDLISFRGLLRTDGDLIDTAAIKLFVNSAT